MFGKLLLSLAAAAALVLGAAGAAQAAAPANVPQASFAPTGPQTLVPYGWFDFCNRYKGECDTQALPPLDVNLTASAYREIERINVWVNASVKPLSDEDHWQLVDQWDYPIDGYGDCEDYALMKRKLLMEEGFPRQALLMTVVKDTHGDGHAVLTVKTNRGEFILDNLTNAFKPWDQTGYRFVKRQSQTDPNVWVNIGEPTAAPDFVSR
jgi:predicted transglutaminase-like cysteine proteinase